MKLYYKIALLSLLFSIALNALAEEKEKGTLTHKIVVGYHIGGTMPVPLPEEVRSISSYWPQFTPQLGYNLSYQVGERWALETGVTLDWKGMGVRDRVKYMYTNVMMDDERTIGYFTGKNETEVKIAYVTIPVRVAYDLTPTWRLRAGGFFSYRNSSEFSGTVWDGYIRKVINEDDKLVDGKVINIPDKGKATFDFGKEMRNFDMGVSVGFEHEFPGRFGIYGDFTYSLTPIFPSDFTGINMKMRNVYLVIGASYRL